MKMITLYFLDIFSLSWRLFARTISAKYRKSFLGYFWMFAPAIFITGGVTLASRAGILNPGETVLPYPLFVFFGTLLWLVFAESLDVGHRAFEGARSFLVRVRFPHEAIILAQFYEVLITTAIRLALTMLLLLFFHHINATALWLVPLCFIGSLFLGLGLGMLLMPFTILFEDLRNTVKLILSYGLFITPAMYLPEGDGLFATIIRWNPVTPLMHAARESAGGVPLSSPGSLMVVLGIAFIITVIGFTLVRTVAPVIIERMLMGGR
jgi:lipopolysaccharide transport system permease protein